jgi:homoserine kinase
VKLTVRTPATVANLGPGFDCLALALDLENECSVDTDLPPGVEVIGEGSDELPTDATNLVFRTIAYVAREVGKAPPPFRMSCANRIPLQRGLGSSAAAVTAGALLADRLLGTGLSADRLLEIAVDIEGHADNVAACLRGGVALAYLSPHGWRAERLGPSPQLQPVLLIPEGERVATEDARRVLPRSIPLANAAFNLGRVGLAVLALTQRPDLLVLALEDRVHQPYRFPLMPAAQALFQELRHAGFPVCVAGSGPTLMVFEQDGRTVWDLGPGWRVLRPQISPRGAAVEESA